MKTTYTRNLSGQILEDIPATIARINHLVGQLDCYKPLFTQEVYDAYEQKTAKHNKLIVKLRAASAELARLNDEIVHELVKADLKAERALRGLSD